MTILSHNKEQFHYINSKYSMICNKDTKIQSMNNNMVVDNNKDKDNNISSNNNLDNSSHLNNNYSKPDFKCYMKQGNLENKKEEAQELTTPIKDKNKDTLSNKNHTNFNKSPKSPTPYAKSYNDSCKYKPKLKGNFLEYDYDPVYGYNENNHSKNKYSKKKSNNYKKNNKSK